MEGTTSALAALTRRATLLALLSLAVVHPGRAAAEDIVGFARCLKHTGTTYFRASWCPHCGAQERLFGGARAHLGEIDCSRPRACGNVTSFPTWTFRSGARVSGVMSLAALSRRTGCPLPEERARRAPDDDDSAATRSVGGVTTRERRVGGMNVIEVR
jgi:hypothetical protein